MTNRTTFGVDLSSSNFYIRRMDTHGFSKASKTPSASLPMVGFVYLTDGELLVESCGQSYLCSAGHLLLIPEMEPFTIPHFSDAVGYTGCFATSLVNDARRLSAMREPIQQAFWFDEGIFMAELFNMLAHSFERNDMVFIGKGLDLLVSRIKSGKGSRLPERVSNFLDSIFDNESTLARPSEYAGQTNLSGNYLNRIVKEATGRPVSDWLDIARIGRAKKLLEDPSIQIIDVAAAVGIDDQSYFSRFFKRQTGMTPSAFRKMMHG